MTEESKPKLFGKASKPATEPGAVYELTPFEEPAPVVIDAYVVPAEGENGFETQGNITTGGDDVEKAGADDDKQDGGHSITDEESGSESGEVGDTSNSNNNKKYCGGRLSLCWLVLLIVLVLAVIAIPVSLVMKNDLFTRNNSNEVQNGQCLSPRCFTDSDCAFASYANNADTSNTSNTSNVPPTITTPQCNHAVLRCSNEKDLMTDFCPCFRDSDCVSGRCEGFSIGFSKCVPLLEDGSFCNEATDCESNRCDRPQPGKAPVCMQKVTEFCGSCNEDTDCASGDCNYLVGRCNIPESSSSTFNMTDASNSTTYLDEGCSCLTAKDCMTGRCDANKNNIAQRVCRQKAPSCGGCNENSDCASNDCMETVFRCRNENGKMDDKCNCLVNGDCDSDRCEALSLNPLDGFFCFPKNADCRQCNEDSDCQSGKCNLLNFMCGNEDGNILGCWI